jgi:site-specific recombinase XerD
MNPNSLLPVSPQTISTPYDSAAAHTLLQQAAITMLSGRSPHTQRAYRIRLEAFLGWHADRPPMPFVAHLREYIAHLQAQDMSPRTIQAHVNTIKGLFKLAAALDSSGQFAVMLPTLDLAKPPAVRGEVQGDRLTEPERQSLIDQPGTSTNKGRRDTAILGMMAWLGLRRAEVAALNWHHLTTLDGHRVIRNLKGKHGRVRTIKLPEVLWQLLDRYAERAELDRSPNAPVFVAIGKWDDIRQGRRLTASAVAFLVESYTKKLGMYQISPHDLRRTAAKLARQRGASIEQVQVMLGHASPQTTSAYIGETLNLDDHAVDYADVRIKLDDGD